jgi:hypothetical protein
MERYLEQGRSVDMIRAEFVVNDGNANPDSI